MGNRTNKLTTNYIYNTAYQILVLIAPLITTPYVSRVLGATGIGVYNYCQSIATYFVYIGTVGTTIYGQREIAYAQNDPEKKTKIFWEIVSFKAIAVAICAIVYIIAFCTGTEYSAVYEILTIEVIATAFDISWFFMGLERFRLTVIRNTIIKLLGIVLIFVFVKSQDDVLIYTLCLTAPIFIGNISLWVSLPKYLTKTRFQVKNIVHHIKPSFLLFIPQLAIEIYAVLDRTMLGALAADISEVGFYSQASRVIRIILAVITSLGTVMLPAMSAAFARGEKETVVKSVQRSFHFNFMLSFALMFGICGIAKNFVPIFFGPGYDEVISLMVIISPILVIIGVSNIIGRQFLLPTQQEKYFTISVVTGAVVNIILNFILIGQLGAAGASIATVIAELSVTAVQMFIVRNQMNLKKCIAPALKYLICGVIMFVIVYFTGEILGGGILALILQIIIGIVIYLIELIITRDSMLREGIQLVLKGIKKK